MIRVLMIHFSPYPIDVRPRREAETFVEAGMTVDTICIKRKDQPSVETHSGVTAFRLDLRKSRSGKLNYILEYLHFAIVAFFKVTSMHFRKKYNLIHVHNMPDFLVFCALIPRLTGAKILLDLHDPVPEIYRTKYELPENHIVINILKIIEKISIAFADHVITPNKAFRDLFIERGCPPNKIDVIMNTPMEKFFINAGNERKNVISVKKDEFILMYHGFVSERNGCLDLIESVDEIKDQIPGLKLHMFGSGDAVDALEEKIKEKELSDLVKFHGLVLNEIIFDAIKKVHLGIIPNQKNPFTNLNFPVRIFEYLALNKPVIVPRTDGILDYFNDDSIIFFDAGNISSLSEAIINTYKYPDENSKKLEKGYTVYQKYTWHKQRQLLKRIALALCKK